jgi:GNAT superfamily N-acetyltransferase
LIAMGVAVREAKEAEIEALAAIYEWLFAPPGSVPPGWDPERAREALAEAIEDDRSAVFVAAENRGLIGLCTAYLDLDSVRFGRRCWVEDLVVDPERRSHGIGKALLDAAKEWARERGASHLELDSGDARADAHRFYEREGPSWTSRCFAWEL